MIFVHINMEQKNVNQKETQRIWPGGHHEALATSICGDADASIAARRNGRDEILVRSP